MTPNWIKIKEAPNGTYLCGKRVERKRGSRKHGMTVHGCRTLERVLWKVKYGVEVKSCTFRTWLSAVVRRWRCPKNDNRFWRKVYHVGAVLLVTI